MTRVLICGGESIQSKGLEAILRQSPGFEVLPSCSTLAGFAPQLAEAAPDLLLLDLTPEVTFAALCELRRSSENLKVVLWVNSISTDLAFQAVGLGIRGILRKSLTADLQVKCLMRVQEGELWFEKALTDNFLSTRRVALTRREAQLVGLLSQGFKNKEIAAQLMISEGTVKVYLSRLFQKAGVKDRFELALFGVMNLTAGQLTASENGPLPPASALDGLRSLLPQKPSRGTAVPAPFSSPLLPKTT